MTPNELLLWLSARKQGSWVQFRSAVENLELAETADEAEQETALPLHQRVRLNLERLAHVEFDATGCEDGWRVVPPVLAIFEHDAGASGVLCGARTAKLVDRISAVGTGNGLSFDRVSEPGCPDVIRVHAQKTDDLTEVANRAGVGCQTDCPTTLLSQLPPVDANKGWKREPLPVSGKEWDVKQFIVKGKTMRWETVSVREANAPEAQGLFCFTRYQRPQYFLREGQECVRLPGAVAKYLVLARRRRRVLRYERPQRRLSMPAILRPPLLTERGLVLCSGFPPAVSVVHKRRMLTYRDIPEEVSGITAEILRQDFL